MLHFLKARNEQDREDTSKEKKGNLAIQPGGESLQYVGFPETETAQEGNITVVPSCAAVKRWPSLTDGSIEGHDRSLCWEQARQDAIRTNLIVTIPHS